MLAQGSISKAKEDTVYLVTSTALTTDLSQTELNLTTSPVGGNFGLTGAFRNSDFPRQIRGSSGRDLYVRVDIEAGSDKDLVFLACGPSDDRMNALYLIGLDGSGNVICESGGTVLYTASIVTPNPNQQISISWSTRPNPDTTGGSDACVSELRIFKHGDNAYNTIEQFTHPVGVSFSPFDTFMVGGYGNADDGWLYDSRQVRACRVGRAWRPNPEVHEDWIGARAVAPKLRIQNFPLIAPMPKDAGFGDENEWIGMANAGMVKRFAQTTLNASRYFPLINEVYRDPLTWHADPNSNTSPQWFRQIGLGEYRCLTTLRWIQFRSRDQAKAAVDTSPPYTGEADTLIPDLLGRVHVKSWVTAGAAVPLRVCMIASSRPSELYTSSHQGPWAPPAWTFRTRSEVITVNHGAGGVGEWVDLPLLPIADLVRDTPQPWKDGCYLCLGLQFDPSGFSMNDANARAKINAWQVRPAWPAAWEEQ